MSDVLLYLWRLFDLSSLWGCQAIYGSCFKFRHFCKWREDSMENDIAETCQFVFLVIELACCLVSNRPWTVSPQASGFTVWLWGALDHSIYLKSTIIHRFLLYFWVVKTATIKYFAMLNSLVGLFIKELQCRLTALSILTVMMMDKKLEQSRGWKLTWLGIREAKGFL